MSATTRGRRRSEHPAADGTQVPISASKGHREAICQSFPASPTSTTREPAGNRDSDDEKRDGPTGPSRRDGETSTSSVLPYEAGLVMVLPSSVTAPVRVSNLPSTVAPVFSVIEMFARMFPLKTEVVPSVAELPTCQ